MTNDSFGAEVMRAYLLCSALGVEDVEHSMREAEGWIKKQAGASPSLRAAVKGVDLFKKGYTETTVRAWVARFA